MKRIGRPSSNPVLVINEPFVEDFCRTQRWAARTRGRVLRPPDWLAYATAVLEQDGVPVELHDFPARRQTKEDLRRLVRDRQPPVVVLDCTTPSVTSDIDCARICKEEAPDCRIIMVGPHATVQDAEVLREARGAVDAIARGEYEYTVRDFVRAVQAGSSWNAIAGLTFLDGEHPIRNTVRNPDRPPIANLDELPFPAWHHLRIRDYFNGIYLFPFVDIIGGRGCPYQCSFCLWPQVMHGNRYRLRSPGNIVDEMEWVLQRWPGMQSGEFFFEDDTFTVDPERAAAICEELMRRDLRVTWSINSRADVLKPDLFKLMKRAGCRMVLVGFESADQTMLDRMHKRTNVGQMREFISIVRAAGLVIHGCFVLGLPGETEASMEQTIRFALEEPLDTVQFSAAVPFPGTKYFAYCRDHDLLQARHWDEWLDGGEQSSVVDYPGLPGRTVNAAVDRALGAFYMRPSYWLRFFFSTRGWPDVYRKARGLKNYLSYMLERRRRGSGGGA